MDLRISRRGDYALRAALCLARAARLGEGRKIREVALEAGVPRTFAPQVLADLVRAGIASSKTGKGGGYWLARPAGSVSMLEIVEAAEGPLARHAAEAPLASGEGPNDHVIHATVATAARAVRSVLGGVSLEAALAHPSDIEQRSWDGDAPLAEASTLLGPEPRHEAEGDETGGAQEPANAHEPELRSSTQARERKIRVVVVEDHALMREGTVRALDHDGGFEVVGSLASAEEALELLADEPVDVAVVDVNLPGLNGLALARIAAERFSKVRVLVLSAYDDYAYVIEAMEAEVGGYLLKTSTGEELADAVRTVAGGAFVLDGAISRRLLRRSEEGDWGVSERLTRREAEVLGLLARGMSNRLVAQQLGLGVRTVEGYVSKVLTKLGVESRTEAALYAATHSLPDPAHLEADLGH